MGIFRKLMSSRSPSVVGLAHGGQEYALKDGALVAKLLEDPDVGFNISVVGTALYQHALEVQIAESNASYSLRAHAILQPQPENPHDPSAVGVVLTGGVVGHLSAKDARQWQPKIIAAWKHYGRPVAVPARIHRGADGTFEVQLALPRKLVE